MQKVYLVNENDNVVTALSACQPGEVTTIGAVTGIILPVLEAVQDGHKIALQPIAAGEMIYKYATVIGCATHDIAKGQWVHLHNMKSNYDQRSSNIDAESGKIMDTRYE